MNYEALKLFSSSLPENTFYIKIVNDLNSKCGSFVSSNCAQATVLFNMGHSRPLSVYFRLLNNDLIQLVSKICR